MKSLILFTITVLTVCSLFHLTDCIYYTNNPSEKIIETKERWSHKQIREEGQIKPDVKMKYHRVKYKRVSIEGHYFYKSITLIDTLPDAWITTDI